MSSPGPRSATPLPPGSGHLLQRGARLPAQTSPCASAEPPDPAGPARGGPGRLRPGRAPRVPGRNRRMSAPANGAWRPCPRRSWTGAWRSPARPNAKMLINALNSGARVYMADFEDSLAPTLDNLVLGQADPTWPCAASLPGDPAGQATAWTARRHPHGPAPGPAPPGRAPGGGGAAGAGLPVRRGPVPVPQRPGAVRAGRQAPALPAQAGAPPGSALVEPGAGSRRARPGPARRQHPHHHAHRDPAGGLPDGRDPPRAARPGPPA